MCLNCGWIGIDSNLVGLDGNVEENYYCPRCESENVNYL